MRPVHTSGFILMTIFNTLADWQAARAAKIARESRFSAVSRSIIQPAEIEARLLAAFNLALQQRHEDSAAQALAKHSAESDYVNDGRWAGDNPANPIEVETGERADPDETGESAKIAEFATGFSFIRRSVRGREYEQEQLKALAREMLRRCAKDLAMWTAICDGREALDDNEPFSANAERMALEAFDWIVQPEADAKLELARNVTLSWLRSGLPIRAFCQKYQASRPKTRRAVSTYCAALADRLSKAPPRREVRVCNNDHLYRPPGFDPQAPVPYTWHAPLLSTHRLDATARNPDIAIGLDEIAAGIKRRPSTTLRLIEGGKLPVAKIGGEHVASMKACRAALRTPPEARLAA